MLQGANQSETPLGPGSDQPQVGSSSRRVVLLLALSASVSTSGANMGRMRGPNFAGLQEGFNSCTGADFSPVP